MRHAQTGVTRLGHRPQTNDHSDLTKEPEENQKEAWKLTDLIDVDTLQSIQDTFARAFGIPTVIVDPAGVNATEITHRLSFCEDFTRTSVIGSTRCHTCDRHAMQEAASTAKPKIFECWNGLYDCAIPIAPKGDVLGYFLCGQIRTEPPDPRKYEDTALEIGVDPRSYREALRDVRILPLDRYEASVESMHVLAQMIGEQAAAAIDNFRILSEALEAKDDASRLMEELDSILKSLSDIGSQPNYGSTLEAIGDNLARLIPSDSCLFYVVTNESDRLTPALVRDPYPEALSAFRPRIGEGILGKVAAERGPRLIVDATVDPDYVQIPGAPVEAEAAMIVVPMVHNDELLGVISLSRFGSRKFTEHEFRILSVLASTQAALAIENARMQERERELLNQYRLLADLGTDFATASSPDVVKDQLLAKTAAIFHTDTCFIASIQESSEVGITARQGRKVELVNLTLSGSARLASVRLRAERFPDTSIFETWAGLLMEDVADRLKVASYLAEPLISTSGVIGGLFVGWSRATEPPAGERRILRVVAGAAGATLSNFAEHADTDSSLHRRVRQLQSLTFLAERITGLTDESRIVDELLRASVDVGSLAGACYLVREPEDWSVEHDTSELSAEDLDRVLEAVSGVSCLETVKRFSIAGQERGVIVIPLPGEGAQRTAVAAITNQEVDAEVESLLTTLARYGAMAIERARLLNRQHETIARLERANLQVDQSNKDLKRLLAVHTELTIEVLEGIGLRSVARSLASLTDGDVAILGARGNLLAESPEEAGIEWTPKPGDGIDASTMVAPSGSCVITAAPAVLGGEVLAWVVLRSNWNATEIERAAIEHGALLAALELLRERTTLEVETRLRGGLLEELFSGSFSEDMILKQGLALGFDLMNPSRVILVEPASEDATRADVEAIFGVVSERARRWGAENMVTVKGNCVVIICKEHDEGASPHFEDAVMESLSGRIPKQSLNVASGTQSDSLSGYRESYTAARRGLDLLRIMGRSGAVFSFRSAGVEHLLLQTNEPEIVFEFTSKYVDPLEAYDRTHSSELLQSLETFYSTGMNLEKTARILHIHVSTLRYRLGKVEELLHMDPRGQNRLDIELALRAARVLAAYRN